MVIHESLYQYVSQQYESLIFSFPVYRKSSMPAVSYQRATLDQLRAFFLRWQPNDVALIPGSLFVALNEYYCYDPDEQGFKTCFEHLRQSLFSFLRTQGVESFSEATALFWTYWLEDSFLNTKQSFEDWDLLRTAWSSQCPDPCQFTITEQQQAQFNAHLERRLTDLLKEDIRLKCVLTHHLKKPLILAKIRPARHDEIITLCDAFMQEKTPAASIQKPNAERFVEELVVSFEMIPNPNAYPTWDFQTVSEALWDEAAEWLFQHYLSPEWIGTVLAEEPDATASITDSVQKLLQNIWDQFWISQSLETLKGHWMPMTAST